MLKAAEANAIAQKFKQIQEILWILEKDISDAAKDGEFDCISNVDIAFGDYIRDAIKMVEEAGYKVTYAKGPEHEPAFYQVTVSWKDAEL